MGGEFDVSGCGFSEGCRSQRCVLKRVVRRLSESAEIFMAFELLLLFFFFFFSKQFKNCVDSREVSEGLGLEMMVVKRGRLYQRKTPRGRRSL